ncbi:sensor histidine kinase [Glycocaulis abyssi]|uniref:histidine kinase n=1 Tax=Glycocaulis abyssi TaxID=1433403 RepID=A0ABV9NGN1_9PROT
MLAGLSEALENGSRRGLRVQLLAVLVLALMPLLVLSSVQGLMEYEQQREREIDRLHAAALTASEAITAAFSRADGKAGAIASWSFALMDDPAACERTLRHMTQADITVSNIAVLDAQGELVCSAVPPASDERNYNSRDWFQALRDGADRTHSDVVFGAMSQRQVVLTVRRLRAAPGVDGSETDIFAGVVAVATDMNAAARLVRRERLSADAQIALISRQGALKLEGSAVNDDLFEDVAVGTLLEQARPGEAIRAQGTGVRSGYEVIVASLLPERLGVAIAAPARVFENWSGISVISTFAIPALMTLLVLVCVWMAVDYFILRWLTYLQRIAQLYAAGRLDLVPQRARKAPREVARLAAVMEQMAASLDEQRTELAEAVDQRSGLLREIHHRVKNNLQVIVSLLNLQSGRISDPAAAEALMDARRRINALALVHRSLYETDDLRFIEIAPFLKDLIHNLAEVLGGHDSNISVEIECEELALSPDQAAPMALFVTEAVTNAFKHAFAGRDSGRIVVRLICNDDDRCEIAIGDNGNGASPQAGTGTGSSLMHAFAQQLGGQFTTRVSALGGYEATVSFPVSKNWDS